jgi:tubulin beta
MGINFWEVVCDEHGIGGDGEYCGGNLAQLDRISVCYVRAPRGVLRTRTGVINALRAAPLGELFRPGNLVNQNAGAGAWAKTGSKATSQTLGMISAA